MATETTQPPAPAVGDPVVIIEGLPYSMTWDDGDDPATGIEGTVVRIDTASPAPFEVRAADGKTHWAARVRVTDHAYRTMQAAKTDRHQAIDLRRLELLEAALVAYVERPGVPREVRRALSDLMSAAAGTSSAEFPSESDVLAAVQAQPDAALDELRCKLGAEAT